ncbi:hypothetical protein ABMA27_012241 [Loxostege sticticalis]|uniref:C2H2-type domain-containing protein n=1 Tax=Loxostege sticticalis TaxID=481309 RepID=A0ABR3H0R8_LOXSC
MTESFECTPEIHIEVVEDSDQYTPYAPGELLTQTFSQPFSNYCSPCNLHFDDLSEFDYHVAEVHKHKLVKNPKPQIEKVFVCSMCNLTFKRQDHLKRHVRSIHNSKKYTKCPVCSKEFQEKEVLSQHIKNVHAGKNETYNCRECPFQCDNLKTLLIHELDHMERHACPHCSLSYKRRDHMTRHVKTEHMKMVVVCPVCEQVYKRKDHLVRHMREKHKENGNTLNSQNATCYR